MSRRDTPRVRAALKLPAGSAAADLAANVAVLDSPTMPALERFSGVLFAALDVASFDARTRRPTAQSVLVFSGGFGVLTAEEPLPLHRVPASATLPAVGGLATFWRKALAGPMSDRLEGAGLVVDLRSSDYAAMWTPAEHERRSVVSVRVLERRDGVLRSVSWSAKHGKGLLARELLRSHRARTPVSTTEDVCAAAERIGYAVARAPGSGSAMSLDLVVPGPL
jgi:cytoplasmic iron level regulating protein YaaA (DUF328/UPF0246 family)